MQRGASGQPPTVKIFGLFGTEEAPRHPPTIYKAGGDGDTCSGWVVNAENQSMVPNAENKLAKVLKKVSCTTHTVEYAARQLIRFWSCLAKLHSIHLP